MKSHLVCIIWEVNLVKYLSCLVLDGLHLHMMRRVFPLPDPHRSLQPLETVQGHGVSPGVEEVGQLLHQALAAVEQPGGEPEQLPAALVAAAHRVVRQLLQDLAVDLVTQNLLRMNLPYFR